METTATVCVNQRLATDSDVKTALKNRRMAGRQREMIDESLPKDRVTERERQRGFRQQTSDKSLSSLSLVSC